MICYRDKTFCGFYDKCKHGKFCRDALTEEIKEEAVKWWGGQNAPISFYAEPPSKCYEAEDYAEP